MMNNVRIDEHCDFEYANLGTHVRTRLVNLVNIIPQYWRALKPQFWGESF